MTTVKVGELVVGCVYRCRLSGLHLLIEKIPLKWVETMQGKQITQWDISALYFNPLTGSYNHIIPVDDQLIELE